MRAASCLAALLLAASPAAAGDPCRPGAPRLCLFPDPAATAALVILTLPVGSADEGAHEHGLAHYVEHLAFRTPAAEAAGIDVYGNAYTTPFATTFHWTVPPARAGDAVRRAMTTLDPLDVPPDAAEAEREVVAREREEAADGPEARRAEAVDALLHAGTPLARPLIGTADDVVALSLPAAQAFHANHYRPETATLLVAGRIDPEAVRAALGPLAPGEPPRAPRLTYDARPPAHLERADTLGAPERTIDAVAALPEGAVADAALTLLGDWLGSTLPGAPHPALVRGRDDLRDAAVGVWTVAPGWGGLGVTLTLRPGGTDVDAPWAAWQALWDGLVRDGLDDATVARLAERSLRDERRARADGPAAAWSLAAWLEAGFAPADWAARPAALEAVTPADVDAALRALDRPLRAVTTTTLPAPPIPAPPIPAPHASVPEPRP